MEQIELRKKKKNPIYLILAIIFAVVAIGAVGFIIYCKNQEAKLQKAYEELTRPVESETTMDVTNETTSVVDIPTETEKPVDLSIYNIPEVNLDFDSLQATNADIYAWIKIPDTKVDYPILQHAIELDYYLDYNMDGSKGYPGCIYSQFINKKDFTDFNTVLYGHNMKTGTMFANLHFYEDPVFFKNHPYIYIYTKEGPLVYQVFGAYTFSDVHLLMGFDLSTSENRQAYIDNVLSLEGLNNNFDTDVNVDADSKILTLETCTQNQETKRYVVAAVLVADGRGVK